MKFGKASLGRPELFGIVLLAILFRGYKAHYTGIIMDEAMTYWGFSRSPIDALTTYGNPCNNHVLNSLAIHVAGRLFGFYEHFPRIPSFLCSVVFCCSIVLLVSRFMQHRLLGAVVAFAILFNGFILDLSFLARGYAYALAALYAELAYLLLLHEKGALTRSRVIASLAITNFITLAAMLSTFWILTALGISTLFLFSTERQDRMFWKTRVIDGVMIVLATSVLLALFYLGLWREILAAGRGWQILPFLEILQSLGHAIFTPWSHFHAWLLAAVSAALVMLHRKRGDGAMRAQPPLLLILGTTAGTWLLLFVHQPLLGLSIGLDRNHVMVLPLTLLLAGILTDRAASACATAAGRRIALTLGFATFSVLAAGNHPSASVVSVTDWKFQSVSRILVRALRHENPERVWRIRLTESAGYLFWPLIYYMDRGYPIDLSRPDQPDIILSATGADGPAGPLLKPALFQPYGCLVEIIDPVSEKR